MLWFTCLWHHIILVRLQSNNNMVTSPIAYHIQLTESLGTEGASTGQKQYKTLMKLLLISESFLRHIILIYNCHLQGRLNFVKLPYKSLCLTWWRHACTACICASIAASFESKKVPRGISLTHLQNTAFCRPTILKLAWLSAYESFLLAKLSEKCLLYSYKGREKTQAKEMKSAKRSTRLDRKWTPRAPHQLHSYL